MQIRCTTTGYLGLLVALAAAAVYLMTGLADNPAVGQDDARPPAFTPSEKIDVEQAVAFPYNI